jgi:prepilin-type processing-associated H-X9-DG protein
MWALLLPYIDQEELARRYDYSVGFNNAPNLSLGDVPVTLYTCPADSINAAYSNRRNYFGVVGGQTLFSHGWRGDVFMDGLFPLNLPHQRRDVIDGLANTFSVGESHLPSKWGLGPGYGNANVGGIPGWAQGSTCANPDCTINNESYGRDLRETKYPINALPFPIADDQDNDVAFGSLHSGGCNFLFADGRVAFIRQTIDMTVYRSLSTCAGGEVLADGAY